MEMVKAIGLKKYYVTDSYEVHALDGVTFFGGRWRISCNCGNLR